MLQSCGSKNRGQKGSVCNSKKSTLHQAVDNLEEINEPDQVTNACAGHRGRKRRKT